MNRCRTTERFRRRRPAAIAAAATLLLTAANARADIAVSNRVVTTPRHVFTLDETGLPAQIEIRAMTDDVPLAWRGEAKWPAALLRNIGRGPQLASPVRLEVVSDGVVTVAKADAPAELQKTDKGVEAVAAWQADTLKGRLRFLYAQDGSMAGQVTFDPAGAKKLERMDLVLELSGPVDTAIAGNPSAAVAGKPLAPDYGSLADGPAMIWSDGKTPAGDGGMHKGRVEHFFLGAGDRGFTWLAGENDGFAIGGDEPSMSVERNSEGITTWRISLVNTRARGGERTAAFTLLTHPSRLPAADRRLQQWQPWPEQAAVPPLTVAARVQSKGDLVRAEAGSVCESVAVRALLAGPAGGDALSAEATLADRFPIGLFRYLAGPHTALAAQLRSNASALVTPGASPAADRMVLGRALLHDIGVDLAGLAGRSKAADIVSALEEFGYFKDDGQTEFLPYWRTADILRYGEDFDAEAKEGFAVTKENPAGRTRVSVFLRPDGDAGGNARRKALFVVVNEGDEPVRENLYIENPVYLFGGYNRVTAASIYGQLGFSHMPAASDWRRGEVLKSMPDLDPTEVKAKVKTRSQADRKELAGAVIGHLQDMESGGYVQTVKQAGGFVVCGPVFVPARGMRLLFGSGAVQAGIVGSVYKVAVDGTRTPVSVPVHIFSGEGVEVADKLDAIKSRPIAKLQSDGDGSFRLSLPADAGSVTVVAEIDGKLYPDAQHLTQAGAYWPAMSLSTSVTRSKNDIETIKWAECVIEAYEGAGPRPKPVDGPAAPEQGKPWTSPVTGMEFVWIPAGKFMMGSPETEPGRSTNETLHEVTLTKGFWMSKYEVTQGQWKRVMGYNPSHFKYAGDNAPVENVDWGTINYSGSGFIDKLNAVSKESGVRYRLPTEAEWEYACRAGEQGPIYTGPLTIKGAFNAPELGEIAWYGGNSGVNYPGAFDTRKWRDRQYDAPRSGTHPVGEKKPNAWGLHDMLGNVSEWVYDMYTNLPPDSVTDPVIEWEDKAGNRILDATGVIRGGGWYRLASGCRSAYRQPDLAPHGEHAPPTDNYVGFRLVCESEVVEKAPAP